jgi:hypothetical protein
MTLPIWGGLEKAQDDATTIDEAIATAIAEHDDNTEAHLSSGQSLQTHRSDVILDARAGSVVRDKLGYDRFLIAGPIESVDAWAGTDPLDLLAVSDVLFATGAVINTEISAYLASGDGSQEQASKDNFQRWMLFAFLGDNDEQVWWLWYGDMDIPTGCGFKIIDSALYWGYYDSSENLQTTQIAGIDVGAIHQYEMRKEDDDAVHWYLDGVEAGSVDLVDISGINGPYFYLRGENTEAVNKKLYIRDRIYEADFSI